MRKIATPADTFDEPWKQIVRALFQPFLEFFAPGIAEAIDWIMTLPDPLEGRFEVEYEELERTHAMAETMPPIIRRAARTRGSRSVRTRAWR